MRNTYHFLGNSFKKASDFLACYVNSPECLIIWNHHLPMKSQQSLDRWSFSWTCQICEGQNSKLNCWRLTPPPVTGPWNSGFKLYFSLPNMYTSWCYNNSILVASENRPFAPKGNFISLVNHWLSETINSLFSLCEAPHDWLFDAQNIQILKKQTSWWFQPMRKILILVKLDHFLRYPPWN